MDLTIILVIFAIFAICTLKIVKRAGASKSIPEVLMESRLGSFRKQLDLEDIVTGPRFSFPILGHLPLLGAKPWVIFTQWKKVYGPIFAIKMGIYDVIVLNESKLIKEAYGRPEFNGRAPFELLKAASEGKGFGFNDGPLRSEQRAFASKCLRGFGFRSKFEDGIYAELNIVLQKFEKECGRCVSIKGEFVAPVVNAVWNIFMGQRFEHDDPQLRQLYDGVHNFLTDDGYLAALSPFVPAISKFMPEFSGYNKKLKGIHSVYAMVKKVFDEPLPATKTFGDPTNFKEAFIDEMERLGDNTASSFHPAQNFFQYSAGEVFVASIDTVSTTLDWLLLYMLKHPAVQDKVQTEIDEKIGTTRVPALSDKDNTPYTEAVIQELLRFSSVAPLGGFFHRVTEDTDLHGYNIKKDTLVIANTYGVHFDVDVWGDPENFRPERFIDGSGTVNRNLMRTMLPFGTGKRNCIGETIARDQIYLYCTNIFQRFHVSSDHDIKLETTVGVVQGPKEFKVKFSKRFIE